jgi:hypothetical protein
MPIRRKTQKATEASRAILDIVVLEIRAFDAALTG